MIFVIEVDSGTINLLDAAGNVIDPAKEGGNLADIKTILTALRDTTGVKQGAVGTSAWLVKGEGTGGATKVEGLAADGASPSGNPVLVAGSDGALVQTVLTDVLGRLVMAPQGSSTVYRGFSDGKALLSATALAPVRWTAYTEQTSNAQRSIASSSAADAAAGTGARTVKLTYYSVSGGTVTGPFTETITLNGTSYVNTVSTTIAFIEKIEVLTVGSGLTNAGILTLKAGTAGAGATIVTIGAGDGQTFLGHHYVPTGRTMKLTSVAVGLKGADAASYFVKADNPADTSVFERQVSDLIRIGTNQSTVQRSFNTPVEIAGPAHVQLYVVPDSTSSRTYYGSMDYFEE